MKRTNGICALCGKPSKLTFEHIPPRGAFNNSPARIYKNIDILNSPNSSIFDTTGLVYNNSQKGKGLYSLCPKCNNDTGTYYGNAYVDFANKCAILLNSNSNPITVEKVYPLRILKQICSMFCSINGKLSAVDNLRKYVLDKNVQDFDYSNFRVGMYFFKGVLVKYNPVMEFLNIKNSEITILSEIVAYPFGFKLFFSSNPVHDNYSFDITYFSNYAYDDEVNLTLPIIINKVQNIFPNDYR